MLRVSFIFHSESFVSALPRSSGVIHNLHVTSNLSMLLCTAHEVKEDQFNRAEAQSCQTTLIKEDSIFCSIPKLP